MLDRIFGKKKDEKAELKGALMHGVLAGEASKSLSEQERIGDLQINPYLFRSFRIEGMIEKLWEISLEKGEPDLDLLALATLMDGIIRVSHISQLDSHIGYLKTRRTLRRIKMGSPHLKGLINMIESFDLERFTAWSDPIGGWKATLTKVSPREFAITMKESKVKEAFQR